MVWYWQLLVVLGVLVAVLSIAAGLIWYERRLLGLLQDRYGPNRVGPAGLLQVLADTQIGRASCRERVSECV